MNARVTSIREVEWRDSRNGGFMFVFRPGALDDAPQTFVAPLKGPERAGGPRPVPARSGRSVSQRVGDRLPRDSRDGARRHDKVTLAITVVGGLVLFSGALILIGAVAMTKFQRVYEAAVFKTLGANTRTIARMLLFEYGVLGALAGAGRLARRGRADVGRQPLRARDPLAGVRRRARGGVVLTAILVAAIGVLSSLDVLRNKPLATLRAE